jgi:hypothetical protein
VALPLGRGNEGEGCSKGQVQVAYVERVFGSASRPGCSTGGPPRGVGGNHSFAPNQNQLGKELQWYSIAVLAWGCSADLTTSINS